MDDKNVQEMNALEEAAFNDPVKFLNEQHAPRTWTLSTVDLAKTAAVSPYEIMATSEERWGPEKASIASTAIREFARGFMGIAETSVNGSLEDRAKEIIYRSPNMRQKDANRLIEDVMRSGSLARQVENYEASKTAHDNFTAGISNGLGSMVSLALLGWASKSPALVGVAAGLGEAYSAREEMVDRYIQDMGTAEGLAGQLGKYNALATGYGAFAGFVEGSIGVERLAAGALNRYGRLAAMERLARQQGKFGKALAYKTGRQVVATGLEEGGEEFLQSIGQDISVSLTRDMWENPDVKKALIQAAYGALIGSTSGGIMYNVGRKRAIDFIRNWNDQTGAGLTESQIVQAADGILDDVTQTTVDEVATRAELQNRDGQMYETLKNRIREIITATGTTPWTDQNKSMEDYIDLVASTISAPAVSQANGLGIPTSEFLEVADMVVQDNVLQLVPLNDMAELQDIIARQNAILAQQREAKKLGMGDDSARRSAEQRKAVAEKALRYMREEEKARKQLVEAKRKSNLARLGYDEIDQAAKDVKYLKDANSLEEFKAKLPSGTTDEQAKNRFESALMNWIAGDDKTLAEDFILERGPMQKAVDILTANGKAIYDVATKHPDALLREDIANALRKMRHANKDNFLMITQALPRDGHDVMPENILLWNWLFADPATNNQFLTNYATKLAENREQIADGQALFGQKVAPLSKKDLIMQALQDTDQAKAQLAESRGRKYEPLFDQNGAVKEPYLAAAIASYQNQFAPRILYQIGYASMRGELIGDFIDANLWAHTGEGPNVHGWGNYFLADPAIDKKRYYDKFYREGPKLKYDGKEVDDLVLQGVGIFHPDIKDIIKYNVGDVSVTKKQIMEKINRQVKRDSNIYQLNIDTVIDRVKDTVGEEKARKIIADMEKMLTKKGGPFMSLLLPFSPVAYPEIAKIQKKYLKKGSLTQFNDDYVTVYNELVSTFGGDRVPETSYASWFASRFSDLNELKRSAEAVKKLDFDKFTGRTGLTYKGEDFRDWFTGKLRVAESRHGKWVADEAMHWAINTAQEAIENSLKFNTDVMENIAKEEEKSVLSWTRLIPEVKQKIVSNIEKFKDKQPNADVKAVKKFLFDFIESPNREIWPSDGLIYQDWYKDESTLADRDLIDLVVSDTEHGIDYPNKNPDDLDSIVGLMNSIRAANALKRSLDETKSILKNVKKEDLVFKPRASMYKTDKIPEDNELLHENKKLTKQPKEIQDALMRMLLDNNKQLPFLSSFLNFQGNQSWDVIDALFGLGDKQGAWDQDLMNNIASKMTSKMYQHDWIVRDTLQNSIGAATREALRLARIENRPATVRDLIEGIREAISSLRVQDGLPGRDEEWTDIQSLRDMLIERVSKHGLDTKLEDITDEIRTVTLVDNNITGDMLYSRIRNHFMISNSDANILRRDPTINARPDADAAELTAKLLLKYGIRGIRYYGGTDKRGFVTFEPTPVTERLYQSRAGVLAVYDPELQAIILGKNWNELSLVHEFHHRYLEKVWNYFKQAQAGMRSVSKAWLDDAQRLFNMLEIDPNQGTLTTVQQEKFAYMVEAYLTGLGVENQDNLAFQGFLHWIPERYRSIMDLGYLDANNDIQNPMLDEESVAFFNKWFASPLVPSLPSAPDAQRIVNASDEDGEILPSNQKVMNNREKEWGQDSEIQNKADAQLWRGIGENTPSDMRASLDGEKEIMKAATNNMPDDRMLPTPPKQTLREKWFKTRQPDARELAAEAARKYVAANPDRARELAFADPETMVSYDAPVDHGMLIRAVMETVGKGSDEWYILDNNLATVKSMSGSTLALSGDLSHQAYLDAKREIESARELKAIVNYAGTGRGATEKWNGDIRAFAAKRTAAILATEPNSEERKVAIKAFLEEAKTKFSGNTTNAVLNQLDLTGYQTKDRQVFVKWAEKQIKSVSHARLDAKEQAELMKASVAAQLALRDIDSKDLKDGQYVRAVQSAKDIRHWQFVKDKMKKAYIGRWGKFGIFWDNLLGSYAPSAMLMSANTLFFANVPSTAVNTGTIRLAALSIGDNKVDKEVRKGEIKRIKQIFNASGVNIAQMDKPTSPSTLHGEKYTNQEQKHWYNFTFDILGREDNVFRVPTFVDALARIATKNANGDTKKATALFNEYTKLNTTDEDAKIARKQALAVANMAVFTQDGIMASALNHIRSALNTMTRGALGLEPGGFGLGNILAPFLKTGANITEMGLSATLALPRTAIAIAQNKLLGKEIPDIRRLTLISDWINLAWMSVVLALLAAIDSDDDDWYTEPYESGKRYDPNKPYDSVNFGGVWVKLDIFGPMAIPLRTALKIVKEWEKKKLAAVADGLMFGGMEALSDTPLVNQVTDSSLDYMARQPESYWTGFGYNQLNKLVPAQVKTAVRAGSRATGTTVDVGWAGKTLERKFHRNYGLDGERLTTNDLLNILTNRVKVKND